MTSAAEHWAADLAGWAIPDAILGAAAESPWFHDVASFEVDDTPVRESPSHRRARQALARVGGAGTVLDVGCGGGRSSLVLAPDAAHIMGVDGSEDMLASFRASAARLAVPVTTTMGRWPDVASAVDPCDVVVCHHVLYNVSDIEPFLGALGDRARERVVLEIPSVHPQSSFNDAWLHFHGVVRPERPTADDALAVLGGMGIHAEAERSPRTALPAASLDPLRAVPSLRRRLCLRADRDPEIASWLRRHPFKLAGELVTIWWDR